MLAVVAEPEEKARAWRACSRAAMASSKLSLFGFELLLYSYKPTGLPTAVCAKVVEREIGAMTAPVVGSMGEPACTARVPKLWTGEGARGGVSMQPSCFVNKRSCGFKGSGEIVIARAKAVEVFEICDVDGEDEWNPNADDKER
jgi:hypothetical protein